MARKLVLLLTVGLTAFGIPAFAANNSSTMFSNAGTAFMGAADQLNVSRTSPEFTSISLSQPEVQLSEITIDFETFQLFTVEGEPVLPVEGAPAVPQITRLYRIPNEGGVELILGDVQFQLTDGVNPLPYVPEGSEFQNEYRNPMIYGKNAWYPSEVAEISEPMILRDFRVVRVTLYPVQVNPATGQARIYDNINVDIVSSGSPGTNELLNPRRPSGSFKPIYETLIPNLEQSALDDATTTPGTYMIIAKSNSSIDTYVDNLADWKMRKGFDVVVERQASWTSGQMVTAIRNLYNNSDPPLEFVCLFGDPQASFGVPVGGDNSDHSFALGNTADDLEDIGVGRLCGTTTAQMATINAKIFGYERDPWMQETDWFNSAFFYAGTGYSVASNWTWAQWADQQFNLLTGVNNNVVANHSGGVNENFICNTLEDGVCFFLWRGAWVNEMGTGVPSSCNNGWKLPVTFTFTCGTGDFQTGFAVSESWLVAGTPANPKGGVCGIGLQTWSTHPPQNYTLAGGFVYAVANQGLEYLGHAVNSAKVWLTLAFGAGSADATNFSRWCNLLGDPGLSMWTDVPVVMEADHPASLNVGARHVEVTVTDEEGGEPVEDALVVLWKGDRSAPETYVKALTDVNGTAVLPVEINSAGDLRLTVTKRNHKPYYIDIPCAVATQYVTVSAVALDDDNAGGTSGNSDGNLNPGETIDLMVSLTNHGTTNTGTGVTGSLTSNNPNVQVVMSSATFPDIAPGATVDGNAAFRISVAPTMKHNESVLLTFDVTASSILTSSTVEIFCQAGKVVYVEHGYNGPDLEPGITAQLWVTVRNEGDIPLTDASVELRSQSSFVSVTNNPISFGTINPGAQVTNTATPFQITANTLAFVGHQAPIRLIVETSGGYRDTTNFNVFAGTASATDPAGPDAFGYYGYDNNDTDYELHPDFEYVNLSSGLGTDLNLNDSGEQTSIGQVWATARALPFSFTYYGIEYDSITINSNGWIAFGDQDWNAAFRNYPMPAICSASNMIAPYWDDLKTNGGNQGVWEHYDAANGRYIVQWKASAGGANHNQANLDFEVILYDTTLHPSFDGNGRILFQYQDVQMNLNGSGAETSGSSVGIQNWSGTTGLGYAYKNIYMPGAASIVDGRAILFTTDARSLFGAMAGQITDEETGDPIEDATVTLIGTNYTALTDANGDYTMEDVLIGEYGVRVTRRSFNDATVDDILVELDLTTTVDVTMLHPEFVLSAAEILLSIPPDEPSAAFEIINDGNGPLTIDIAVTYTGGGEPVDPWGVLDEIDVSGTTGNMQILGCEFVGDYWYVTASGGIGGENLIYRYDLEGNLLAPLPQPSTSVFGWYDMAWDGEYLYGSEDGANLITGIGLGGNVATTIPSPLNPTRAIAYDPDSDHFWVADYTQDIYELDRDGNILSQISNEADLGITGLAWNEFEPNGFKLFVFSQDGVASETQVTAIHPVLHTFMPVATLSNEEGDRAGGCTITSDWNSALLVFGSIIQNTAGDRLSVNQIEFNASWIDVSPVSGTIPGGSRQLVSLDFDIGMLRDATYEIALEIHNEIIDTTLVMPVTVVLSVPLDPYDPDALTPAAYALHQNFPNPFNPSTTIRYDLREAGPAMLAVYNLVGQEVARLVDGRQSAGRHAVEFEAGALPSGVYFYRLTSGDFRKSAKMILMK